MNKVRIATLNEPFTSYVEEQEPGVYRVTLHHRWKWVRRFKGWLLDRLGGKPYSRRTSVVRHREVEIDFDELATSLCKIKQNIMRVRMREARHVIVGRDYFDLVARGLDQYVHMAWPDHAQPRVVFGSEPVRFLGLQVTFVPWINGLFVLPDLDGRP